MYEPANDCPSIAVVIPVYGALDYAEKALDSLLWQTPRGLVHPIIVDDGSPDWSEHDLESKCGEKNIVVSRFAERGGLTRAWNKGAEIAYAMPAVDYLVLTNSDVLFTPGWWRDMVGALQSGYELVGPVSNLPGPTSGGEQEIERHYSGSIPVGDNAVSLAHVADCLWRGKSGRAKPCNVNGFFMMAAVKTWKKHAYSLPELTFPAVIDKMPSGRTNPTPRMTGQDDWISHQVTQNGGKCGAALGSYIYHYRSRSRGKQHEKDGKSCIK